MTVSYLKNIQTMENYIILLFHPLYDVYLKLTSLKWS